MAGRLETFDIVLYLTTSGAAETDDSSQFATFYKRHVVESVGLRSEDDHSDFVLLEPPVNPYQRGIPVEFGGKGKRHAMFGLVGVVLGRIELDSHALL